MMSQTGLNTQPASSPISLQFNSTLVELTETTHNIILDLRYATKNNITGSRIYHDDRCFIHHKAIPFLERAVSLAQAQALRIKIFDAYRPPSVQEALWAYCPDPNYVMPPEKGSAHTRGVAIDLTLVDAHGKELDMGTDFDDLSPRAHHGASHISPQVAANRYILLGIMMSAGWDFFVNEWWHYQLFKAFEYPLI